MSIKQAIEALEQLVVAVQNATPDEGCEQSIAHARGMGEAAIQSLRSMPAEPVAWTVAGPVTNWSKDFSAYRTQHYVRPVYATPPSAATPEPSDAERLDAARYRWFIDNCFFGIRKTSGEAEFAVLFEHEPPDCLTDVDAAIDAAIHATKGGKL